MDSTAIIITLGSFIAAYVNAVFASGGFFIYLAMLSWVLPMTTVVPLQPSLIYSSLIARVGFFWPHTNWKIMFTFCLGAMLGVFIGSRVFIYLSESLLSLGVGAMLLIITWLPTIKYRPKFKHPFFPVGVLHAFCTTTIGASAVLQMILIRTSLVKLQVTATLASCFVAMEAMRMVGYASVGFNYLDYIPYIVMASIAGILGSWVGKHTEHHISENAFRIIFKGLITIIALRLLYKGWVLM